MKRLFLLSLLVASLFVVPAMHQLAYAHPLRVCHFPGGQEEPHVIGTTEANLPGHLAHGDCLADEGAKPGTPCSCP